MKKNVLVFPCGSEIGLEIYRSTKDSIHFNIIGGSSLSDHGEYVFENYIGDMPFVDDPDFIQRLNQIIAENRIDFIFPAHDSVVLKLAQEHHAGNLECTIITSPLETCEVARSKKKTYEVFDGVVPTPKLFDVSVLTEVDLPVFLKPDVGQGSKGTYLASSIDDLHFYLKKDNTLLALEYLPGKEYTVDCYTDKNGSLLLSEGRERTRIMNGISVRSEVTNDSRFTKLANAINAALIFRGAWFFQVKESTTGELVLMEIAPRIAGTMGLERARGINLPILSLFEANGIDISVIKNEYEVVIDRALENRFRHDIDYKHVYIDFDDLLIVEGCIRPQAIAFVYQCINKKIPVYLITRHREDLHSNLKKYRLEGVFDEIIWVKEGEEKHTYIKEKDAIFIDDSFAERKKVMDVCGIPVFDGHMLEVLIENL